MGTCLLNPQKKYDVPILECYYEDIKIKLDQKIVDKTTIYPKFEKFNDLIYEYCDKMDPQDSVQDIGERIKRDHQLDEYDYFLLDIHLSHFIEAEFYLPADQLSGMTFGDSPSGFGGDWVFSNGYSFGNFKAKNG